MTAYPSPQAVLEAYVDGTRHLDAELLASCFHSAAVMAGNLDGLLMAGGPQPFFNDVNGMKAGGIDHSAVEIAISDVNEEGSIASGVVRTSGFGGRFDFEDRFHLLRDEQGWKIISKLFTTL